MEHWIINYSGNDGRAVITLLVVKLKTYLNLYKTQAALLRDLTDRNHVKCDDQVLNRWKLCNHLNKNKYNVHSVI